MDGRQNPCTNKSVTRDLVQTSQRAEVIVGRDYTTTSNGGGAGRMMSASNKMSSAVEIISYSSGRAVT